MRLSAMRFNFLFTTISIFLIVAITGCAHRHGDVGLRLDSRYLPQITSLSISGSLRALVLTGSPSSPRDLRLTTDGGQTWQVLRTGEKGDAFAAASLADNGLTWGVNRRGDLFTSHSAGTGWEMISNLETASRGLFKEAVQIEFPSETDGWILEVLSIWRTRDGGITWEEGLSASTPGVKGQPTRVYAIDANTLVSAGSEGQVYRTKDGGRSWEIKTLIDADANFTDIWFSDKKNGFVVGYVGGLSSRPLVFVTKDGGETWLEVPIGDQIRPWSVSFVKDEGWLAGYDLSGSELSVSPKPLLLHTVDGGLHWTRVLVSADDPFFSLVRFADREHGWLVGRDNLYRTDDAGKTWRAVLSLAPIQNSLN